MTMRSLLFEARLFLKSVPRSAHWFAIATMAIWLVKALILDDMPRAFPKAFELGKIVDGVIAAIIAGYVFYLFFALLPVFTDRKKIQPYIDERLKWIVGDASAILEPVGKAHGAALVFGSVTKNRIDKAFRQIDPRSQVPDVLTAGKGYPWLEFLEWRRKRSAVAVSELLKQLPYLDAETVSLVLDIDNSIFFRNQREIGTTANLETGLGFYADSFHQYLTAARKLAIHIGRSTGDRSFFLGLDTSSRGNLPDEKAAGGL